MTFVNELAVIEVVVLVLVFVVVALLLDVELEALLLLECDSYVIMLHLSSILVVALSNDSNNLGSWLSSSRTAPQPKTLARSLPVPNGKTPIWHFKV